MPELHLPWIELTLLMPLLGAIAALVLQDNRRARGIAIFLNVLALIAAIGAWVDFQFLKTFEAHDYWDLVALIFGKNELIVDELNAPLLPLCTLLGLLTLIATPATKAERFPLDLALITQVLTVAILACREPWGIVSLAVLQTLLPYIELRRRNKNSRLYLFHMLLFVAFLISGWWLIARSQTNNEPVSNLGVVLLITAVLIRNGCAPLHCWLSDLFEKLTFGTAILFTTPMVAALIAVRLLLPVASEWSMHLLVFASLFTAIYAAAMALVQDSPRSFFACILLSHMSLVFVGLELDTTIGFTGALCGWLSVVISLTGFGLTIRAVEARIGHVSLRQFHGLYPHVPILATFFLLTGLASIGFPGTIGFVGTELVIEGGVELHPWVGILIVVAASLNGIAILFGYFRLFTGTVHTATASLLARPNERIAVWTLSALIFLGGIFPQPGVQSRFHAATEILQKIAHLKKLNSHDEANVSVIKAKN